MSLMFRHNGGPLIPGYPAEDIAPAGFYFWDHDYNPNGPFPTLEECKIHFRLYNDQLEYMRRLEEMTQEEHDSAGIGVEGEGCVADA